MYRITPLPSRMPLPPIPWTEILRQNIRKLENEIQDIHFKIKQILLDKELYTESCMEHFKRQQEEIQQMSNHILFLEYQNDLKMRK